MTPAQAALLTAEIKNVWQELRSIRGLLEDGMDRMVVALSSVN